MVTKTKAVENKAAARKRSAFRGLFGKRSIIVISENKTQHILISPMAQLFGFVATVSLVGWLSYTSGSYYAITKNESNEVIIAIFVALITMAAFLFQYLKAGQIKVKSAQANHSPILEKVSENDKKEIIAALEKKFSDDASDSIVWGIYRNVETKLEQFSELNLSGQVFAQITERLSNEIFSLQVRGKLNLIIGILITTVGLVILAIGLFSPEFAQGGMDHFLQIFLPRLSWVILIEIFAYFFLRLYKSSLDEIKFFHNELTNVEFKLAAIQLSHIKKDEKERFCIINELTKTDRNVLHTMNPTNPDFKDLDKLLEVIKGVLDVAKKTDSTVGKA